MSRTIIPLVVDDLSAFATHLRRHWPAEPPGQSAALALIAQAAGYRNHQHLKAGAAQAVPLDRAAANRVRVALAVFDAEARLMRWPRKTSVQRLCLAWMWACLPDRRDLTEAEVNDVLRDRETIGDHVLLRRSLIDHGYAERSRDGALYRRRGRAPDAEERAVIRALSERRL